MKSSDLTSSEYVRASSTEWDATIMTETSVARRGGPPSGRWTGRDLYPGAVSVRAGAALDRVQRGAGVTVTVTVFVTLPPVFVAVSVYVVVVAGLTGT